MLLLIGLFGFGYESNILCFHMQQQDGPAEDGHENEWDL